MPARSFALIRRHINRLSDLVNKWKEQKPALKAMHPKVAKETNEVNQKWRDYQQAAVSGDKERAERDTAMGALSRWIQEWRPIIIMFVSGAADNIHKIPSSGGTPDDTIRVAEDMLALLESSAETESFRADAVSALGNKLEAAKKESLEATEALPAENVAREAYGEACLEANTVLVQGLNIVRAVFGPKSAEYKQFITRDRKEDEEIDQESGIGEE